MYFDHFYGTRLRLYSKKVHLHLKRFLNFFPIFWKISNILKSKFIKNLKTKITNFQIFQKKKCMAGSLLSYQIVKLLVIIISIWLFLLRLLSFLKNNNCPFVFFILEFSYFHNISFFSEMFFACNKMYRRIYIFIIIEVICNNRRLFYQFTNISCSPKTNKRLLWNLNFFSSENFENYERPKNGNFELRKISDSKVRLQSTWFLSEVLLLFVYKAGLDINCSS